MIPNELLSYLFTYCDFKTVVNCESVSKQFQTTATHQGLWDNILKSHSLPNTTMHPKSFFKKFAFTQEKNLSNRIEAFFERAASCKKNGCLKINFLFNPEVKIQIEFESSQNINPEIKTLDLFVIKRFDQNGFTILEEKLGDQIGYLKMLFDYNINSYSLKKNSKSLNFC
jgi:hypothetical protein